MIAIIDADSIPYLCSKDGVDESIANVEQLLSQIMIETRSDKFILVFSNSSYFRHNVNKDYKGNRPPTTLQYVKTLKSYLREEYISVSMDQVEADDLVSYIATQKPYGDEEYVVCSIDKDVLFTIPGTNYNYRTNEFVTVSKVDAMRYIFKQTLMGDSTDNIKGVPGIGEVKASKIIAEVPVENIDSLPNVVMNVFVSHYKSLSAGIYYFQQNFRLVYLLRTPEEFERELGEEINFEFPTLNQTSAHWAF